MKKLSVRRVAVNRNLVMLLTSLGLGVAGVYTVDGYISEQIAGYRRSLDTGQNLIEVVVPRRDLVRGTRLQVQDMVTRAVPQMWVHRGVVTEADYQNAAGQRLAFDIEAGKPLLWAYLESGRNPTFSGRLPEGMRALTIPVDQINAVSGLLRPNDRIDLMLTYRPEGQDENRTIPLLQDVLVLATGDRTVAERDGAEPSRPQRFSTVTLQVRPDDAKRIILAQKEGGITAVLRHPDDRLPIAEKALTVNDIAGLRENVRPVRRNPAVKKRPRRKAVEFIIGGV